MYYQVMCHARAARLHAASISAAPRSAPAPYALQGELGLRAEPARLCGPHRRRRRAALGQSARSEIPAARSPLWKKLPLPLANRIGPHIARGLGMKDILFLAHRIPYPPDRGDKIRSWHLLKHLAHARPGPSRLLCRRRGRCGASAALREALGDRLGEAHVEIRTRGKAAAGAAGAGRGQAGLARLVRQQRGCATSSRAMLAGRADRDDLRFLGPDGAIRARRRAPALRHGFRRHRFGQVRPICRGRQRADALGQPPRGREIVRLRDAPPPRAPTSACSSARRKRACSAR